MQYITLVPSYGRDYRTQKEVKAAWAENKDFTINTFGHPHDGRQINKEYAPRGVTLNIRFKGLTQVCVIRT